MEITWQGHSCFRLRADDLVVVTDPFPASIGLSPDSRPATMVTVSNSHPNHSYLQDIAEGAKVFRGPGEYEFSGVLVRGIMTTPAPGDPEEHNNTAYHIEMDGLRLAHLGDIRGALAARQTEELTPLEVLFLPVGEVCAVGLGQALGIIRALSPKVVIPMHFDLPGLQVELRGVDGFLREIGLKDVAPQARLNVTSSNIPQEMRVVVLEAQSLRL